MGIFVLGSSKIVIGGSVFLGTGIGAGSALLASSNSKRVKLTNKKASKSGCRIHQLITSSGDGSFKEIEEETLEQEILGLQQGNHFQQIQEACKKAVGKDIFISNRNKNGWKYYGNDAEATRLNLESKFQNYLKRDR